MSDTMLLGVLRMPVDDHGDIHLMQLIERAREAADRIEVDAKVIAEERKRADALAAHVDKLHDFFRTAPIGSGVCMCGDEIATHADPMSCGHSPVDEVEYHADCLMNEAPETSLPTDSCQPTRSV
ncbi:hypothetical protein [Chromohalobacter sp. HP20-39]|uniref:hypothetical protein n=1 Tax=Chromohalobacter sp. HP20-39 TaxID=3079306 RepID=UPI00294B7B7F|nr:hypothetical protein [Chromohalobacter sp. HP20-39]MDV6318765.1 hypothetical protein [Chromohalobacter sp. HP20-39]